MAGDVNARAGLMMAAQGDDTEKFLAAMTGSLEAGTFIHLTLGKPRDKADAQKCVVQPVIVKAEQRLKFVFSHASKDITEIHDANSAQARISPLVGTQFFSANMFTKDADFILQFNRRGEPKLVRSKPSKQPLKTAAHNREKAYIVDPGAPFLNQLGVATPDGTIKPSMFGKFKQICHFIEIVDDLIRASPLAGSPTLSAVDIGSGKGYLTFGLYAFLATDQKREVRLTGIERRADLVSHCTAIASALKFDGLTFQESDAASAEAPRSDIIIALHACDTATDDAIARGVREDAAIIVVAPCCQHELAPQIDLHSQMCGLTRFGLFKQRQADLVTDAARALLLEAAGYEVRVIEFVGTEHTAKNILIAGVRSATVNRERARRDYQALKELSGFKTHHLERALGEAIIPST